MKTQRRPSTEPVQALLAQWLADEPDASAIPLCPPAPDDQRRSLLSHRRQPLTTGDESANAEPDTAERPSNPAARMLRISVGMSPCG